MTQLKNLNKNLFLPPQGGFTFTSVCCWFVGRIMRLSTAIGWMMRLSCSGTDPGFFFLAFFCLDGCMDLDLEKKSAVFSWLVSMNEFKMGLLGLGGGMHSSECHSIIQTILRGAFTFLTTFISFCL